MKYAMKLMLITAGLLVLPIMVFAQAEASHAAASGLTGTAYGYIAVIFFIVAYALVPLENNIHLRKSKPVLLAAGAIWVLVSLAYTSIGDTHTAHDAIKHSLIEYAELFLFLLAAMTYINAMEERNVFQRLRAILVSRGFSLRKIFWITGILAFIISPIADNLTTALLMGAVAMAVGGKNKGFISLACINIVVAANAGGAFSPFGDITTLMVWQKGKIAFSEFFAIFIPSLVNWLVPAVVMSLFVDKDVPESIGESVTMKYGAWVIMGLFLATIVTAICFHNMLHLPPAAGMMLGLGYLGVFSYHIKRHENQSHKYDPILGVRDTNCTPSSDVIPFDVMKKISRAEWDTLLFFYGIILCVGGLAQFGYLALVSKFMYLDLGATWANSLVGVLSAVLDNIPVMFAVLTMDPSMSHGHWLLVTLTAGTGGSMLAIGSAAGVALMGAARGTYTFGGHLKWTPVIAVGYALSIVCHLWLNKAMM
ncbi:sodium:proton antiporter [Desulfobacter hydrogenophilus]|uniref:Sodium:proton antiporter n=1 Tax=Desulfobacter hydrogenophilus TaxID=2291 RepID=A0A328FA64_9BACT|nr:sodium:proton antiporter NhaD [Desulfobacter hydrogenophilus]NDY72611.1 sodium:proton antiporter [Desulfobacter hydrogenophilus]QBH13331.1 sodium:proton antiporter [Desulfobacter hydrogenophilus]RAM01269.1 sodium:proton antiporter [Desulfobacter hydrogenophilus]